MSKKIFTAITCLLTALAFCAAPVCADEATTIFIEGDSSVKVGSDADFRVLILDENGELATTYQGTDIEDLSLTVESLVYGSNVDFTTGNVVDGFTTDITNSIDLEESWVAFNAAYDLGTITSLDTDTIKVTLKKGSESIVGESDLEVKGPSASHLVVLTGGVGTMPDVLDTITPLQLDKGATKEAGDATTVDVFAVKRTGSSAPYTYYYTNNVSSSLTAVAVGGYWDASLTKASGATFVTLVDGHATADVTITDTHLIDKLAEQASTWNTAAKQMAAMSWLLENGVTVTWMAVNSDTEKLGDENGEVNSSDQLYVNLTNFDLPPLDNTYDFTSQYPVQTGDYSWYTPAPLDTVTIIGIPVNGLKATSGAQVVNTMFTQDVAAGTLNPNYVTPLDAYLLNSDWTDKPSSFKVQGVAGSTHIFGAVVGYDQYNNPAPFVDSSDGPTVSLGYTNAAGTDTDVPAENVVKALGRTNTFSGGLYSAPISTTYGYAAIIPFQMTATNSSGTYKTLTGTYITGITAGGTSVASSKYSGIDSTTEGVNFFAQDYVTSITQTIASDIAAVMEDDTEVSVLGTSSEKRFTMSLFNVNDEGFMGVNVKDSMTEDDSVSIPNDEDNLAKADVAVFSNSSTSDNLLAMFMGDDASTLVSQVVTLTANITPVEGDEIEPSSIFPLYSACEVNLDAEGEHNTVEMGSIWLLKDAFGNKYSLDGSTKEDSGADCAVMLVADNGTPSATAFPGASCEFDDNALEVEFDIDNITADHTQAAVKVTTSQGNKSGSVIMDIHALQGLGFENLYIPVPGVDDTPVEMYFIDQEGDDIAPVTATSVTTDDGAEYTVELEVEDGTISVSTNQTLSTGSDSVKLKVDPDVGKTQVTITGESDLGDATHVVDFSPDFILPEVGALTAINCGFEIAITDDQEVDGAETDVTVTNSEGEDITSTITISAEDNETSGVVTVTSDSMVPGTYSVTITAYDAAGNASATVTKTVTVTACDAPVPACGTVDPTFAGPGETATLTITGTDTSFADGSTTVAFSCAGVTVDSVTVDSATQLTVAITIASDAAEGTCDITITTGSEEVVCSGAFEIAAEAPCTDADGDGFSPDGGDCGEVDCDDTDPAVNPGATEICDDGIDNDCDGDIDAADSDCGDNCTDADGDGYSPDGGDCGEVDCDDTDATVNPGATEICDDGIDNDCDGDIDAADSDCAGVCVLASISPSSARSGILLPRFRVVTITGGADCTFTGSSSVDFGTSDVRVLLRIPLSGGSRLLTLVSVAPRATAGTFDVTVDGYGGVSFTIQ